MIHWTWLFAAFWFGVGAGFLYAGLFINAPFGDDH